MPVFFLLTGPPTPELYTLSLHDALPISRSGTPGPPPSSPSCSASARRRSGARSTCSRSEEHTSELQSQSNLVCRLLLEKKKSRFQRHSLMGSFQINVRGSQSELLP